LRCPEATERRVDMQFKGGILKGIMYYKLSRTQERLRLLRQEPEEAVSYQRSEDEK